MKTRKLLLLLPALLLLGCTGCGICLPYPCPQFASPPPWYYEQCAEKGGHMASDRDPVTCCVGPPYCADENGHQITITPPSPTPTATVTPGQSPTPTSTPSGDLRGLNCTRSGGTWIGGEGWVACDCGDEKVYNMTTYECERCPEGQLVGRGLGPGFCYTPTGKQGMPCDRATECGGGSCVLVNPGAWTGKGECHDLPFGCYVRIDENGNYDPEAMLCVD